MAKFSEEILGYLAAAGWYRGRCIGTLFYERTLKAAGYGVCDSVLYFLAEFGGLAIRFPHWVDPSQRNDITFDPSDAAFHDHHDINYYTRLSGVDVCFVGTAEANNYDVFMDPVGGLYLARDEAMWELGKNTAQALEAWCTNQSLQMIPPSLHEQIKDRT